MGGTGIDDSNDERHRRKFEYLYRLHAHDIYCYCLRRVQDRGQAEDACSAVFVEAWRHRATLDCRDRAGLPWLYGVAKNVLRNQRRTLRRREAALTRLPRPISDFECVEDADERMDAARAAPYAWQLIDALPPSERAVVILCLADELSYATVADRLGVPVGTVRSRLFRARERIVRSASGPSLEYRESQIG